MSEERFYLYLHGLASGPGSQKARFFRQRLAERGIELRIPDLAAGDFENLTLSGQLRIVEREAAGRRPILIGSSLGGYLAALFAARHPEVEKLVLLAPAFAFSRRWLENLGPEAMRTWKETGQLEVFHYGEGRMRPLGYALYQDSTLYEDYPDVLQPVLVFHGLRDTVVPAERSREFARNRPYARLLLLDSDHQLLNVFDAIWAEAAPFLIGP